MQFFKNLKYKLHNLPLSVWWKCRKYWKFPKINFYIGRLNKGYIYFVSTEYLKWTSKPWFPVTIACRDLCWKDKYESPRFEMPPLFSIIFGRNCDTAFQIAFWFTAPKVVNTFYTDDMPECLKYPSDYEYWESMIWYLYYAKTNGYWGEGYNQKTGDIDLKASYANYITKSITHHVGDKTYKIDEPWNMSFMTKKAKKIIEQWKKENLGE